MRWKIIFLKNIPEAAKKIKTIGCFNNKIFPSALIPSILISIFSLFLFSFALEKYFDKKVTTVVNNSYELAKSYVQEVRNKIESDVILIAFDTNKSAKFLNDNNK